MIHSHLFYWLQNYRTVHFQNSIFFFHVVYLHADTRAILGKKKLVPTPNNCAQMCKMSYLITNQTRKSR